MSFIQRFHDKLESLHPVSSCTTYVVAYSGGVDSHVLLNCCHELGLPVRAVHIHHGLQQVADDWVGHCQQVCESLDVPLDVIRIDACQKHRQSPEESARKARYQALYDNLADDECLLTGQHLDDQAETFLIQLFRSSGAAGLAAMPAVRRIDERQLHLRPMLEFSRDEIIAYARRSELQWVEDPTNSDTRYERNYIRQRLLPELDKRWSQLPERLSAAARLQADSVRVMEDMARIDLAETLCSASHREVISVYETISRLSISRLKQLSQSRLYNLLRYWVRSVLVDGCKAVTISPTKKLLSEIDKTLIRSQPGTNPVIHYSGYEFRRYKDVLYLLGMKLDEDDNTVRGWDTGTVMDLPAHRCRLVVRAGVKNGLDKRLLGEDLSIAYRQGGEQFHPDSRDHSRSLKKLLQDADVAPWDRDRIPLLYHGSELVSVIGLWNARTFTVAEDENGWDVTVEPY